MRLALSLCPALALLAHSGASAGNIVLSNDDGLTSNVVALYDALTEAGHDVIVSVPCTNQSGMGAAIMIGRPLVPLDEACLNDAAKPGDPGAGAMTRDGFDNGDYYYVNGTPVMALTYGLDVVGKARWGAAPDLVLSGPNEGQNVGSVVISSGTVGNAQFAALRGLPAIALSAGSNTEAESLDNPLSVEIAQLSVTLVSALELSAEDGAILPQGLALNVNFPDSLEDAEWRVTQIGTYNAYRIGFTDNMAENASPTMAAMARARGFEVPPLPGLSFDLNQDATSQGQENDESVVYRRYIAVSPMQAGYEYGAGGEDLVRLQLADLLSVTPEPVE